MLVLTRKIDEQIVIGDDIKITLIRVRGNTVRLGIEAPRDVRIVRGELDSSGDTMVEDVSPLEAREDAFAHPRAKIVVSPKQTKTLGEEPTTQSQKSNSKSGRRPTNRISSTMSSAVYVGKVARDGSQLEQSRAPLASFISLG